MQTNYAPLDDTFQYRLDLLEGRDWVYINSSQNHRWTKMVIDDVSGCITFEGYWYTPAFRAAIDRMYSGEEIYPFTESFDTPVKMSLWYQQFEPNYVDTVQVKTLPFPYMYRQQDAPAEVLNDGVFHTEYLYELIEGFHAEIEVLKREVWEEQKEEEEDIKEEKEEEQKEDDDNNSEDSWYGGGICLTPTYMNRIWFRFVKKDEFKPQSQ